MAGLIKLFQKKKTVSEPDHSHDGGMAISTPTNVKHEVHVGFDHATGQINGLPPVWEAWLNQSNIRLQFLFDP
jgi:P21-Rho-binding domain